MILTAVLRPLFEGFSLISALIAFLLYKEDSGIYFKTTVYIVMVSMRSQEKNLMLVQ